MSDLQLSMTAHFLYRCLWLGVLRFWLMTVFIFKCPRQTFFSACAEFNFLEWQWPLLLQFAHCWIDANRTCDRSKLVSEWLERARTRTWSAPQSKNIRKNCLVKLYCCTKKTEIEKNRIGVTIMILDRQRNAHAITALTLLFWVCFCVFL